MGNLAVVVFFVLLGLGVIFALADVHPSSTTSKNLPLVKKDFDVYGDWGYGKYTSVVDFDRPEYQDKEEPW